MQATLKTATDAFVAAIEATEGFRENEEVIKFCKVLQKACEIFLEKGLCWNTYCIYSWVSPRLAEMIVGWEGCLLDRLKTELLVQTQKIYQPGRKETVF